MTMRDALLALLLAGAMLGPWHTANRLSQLIAVTGGCPDLWPTSGVLVGAVTAQHDERSLTVRALRGEGLNPGDHQ
jgi:hypothetical protein